MRRTAIAAALLALVLSACGAAPATQESKFTGDKAQVAKLVDELAKAGRAGDASKICTQILATQLVNELKSAGGDCTSEMKRAIADATDYDLQVDDVKVTGTTATATVRQGTSKKKAVFSFVKEKGGWRASALGS